MSKFLLTIYSIQINPGQVGFYRTCYSADCFKELVSAIRLKTLAPLDRLGVIDDLFALVQAGQASTVEVFNGLSWETKEFENEMYYPLVVQLPCPLE